jgi:hypothetical protein
METVDLPDKKARYTQGFPAREGKGHTLAPAVRRVHQVGLPQSCRPAAEA